MNKNILESEDIEWLFITSMAFTNCHHSKFIDEQYGLEKEQIAYKRADGNFRRPKTYYFITGHQKEYTDLEELCKDWNEIKNFDDPNKEIKWVKVIKDKPAFETE